MLIGWVTYGSMAGRLWNDEPGMGWFCGWTWVDWVDVTGLDGLRLGVGWLVSWLAGCRWVCPPPARLVALGL